MSEPTTRLEVRSQLGTRILIPAQSDLQHPLTDLLRRANLPLNTRCGQRGLCDGCMIELVHGRLVNRHTQEQVCANGSSLVVRGCEVHLAPNESPVVIQIPERSALGYEPRVVSDFRLNVSSSFAPLYSPPPGEDAVGAAVDIGTTTVVVIVVDLTSGRTLGRAAAFNEQMRLGDDVLTRIQLCYNDPGMLRELQSAVVDRTIKPLLLEALRQASTPRDNLKCLCFAGNTTMLHLLIGADPSPMGIAPFKASFLNHLIVEPSRIFIDDPSFNAICHLLPGAAAYVGADLTAGVIASGLAYDDGPSLLVDVGTNGEIILKHRDAFLGCATAAGPAFEGAGLSCGIRAGDGAIAEFHIADDFSVKIELIGQGDSRPIGLCGSAYIDFLAEGRRSGLLTAAGRFNSELPRALQSRIIHPSARESAFVISHTSGRTPISISQLDVARLLQAKAAIAAGILMLLERAGLKPSDINKLYLAGGFGTHMDVKHAIVAGLLPGFSSEQVQAVGNSALGGAFLALTDRGVLDEINRIARQMQVIELNLEADFESCYIDQLALP